MDLAASKIGDQGAQHIAENLKSLTSVDLGDCGIGEEEVQLIAEHLKSLTHLNICANDNIGNEAIRHIAQLTALTRLQLAAGLIGVKAALHIAEMKSLTSLDIYDKEDLTEEAKQILQEKLPSCNITLW